MAPLIFIFWVVAPIFCVGMLLLQFNRSRNLLIFWTALAFWSGLAFWTALAFCAFAASNLALVIDLVRLPRTDLLAVRTSLTLAALSLQLIGFVRTGG